MSQEFAIDLDLLESSKEKYESFFLGVGDIGDGINALIYLLRGDVGNCLISAVAIIPLIGIGATGAKYAWKYGDDGVYI